MHTNLKMNKASGPDEIAYRSIELQGETVVSTFTPLFTSSFKVDTFPLEKKTGEPLTVHEKYDKMDRGNYALSLSSAYQARF